MNPARRLRGMRLRNGADDLRATRDWQPPLERPEFWAVQLLVFTIAGAHTLLELSSPGVSAHPLQLVPTSLFLVPVVYAALNFGLYGSVPTALWSTVLTIPNILLWHEGEARGAELWQVGVVLVMAVVVGRRVDDPDLPELGAPRFPLMPEEDSGWSGRSTRAPSGRSRRDRSSVPHTRPGRERAMSARAATDGR